MYVMKISPTALRKNLYQLLDQIIESGETIIIQRKGRELEISERKNKGIYQIMDERAGQHAEEPSIEVNEQKLEGLDENWEEQWEQKWDEWLNEK